VANYTFTALFDKVLLWIHGRRLGIKGDGQGPLSSESDVLVLDGVAIGSTRSGPNGIKAFAAGLNGKGGVTVAGAVVGDNVEFVLNLTTPNDGTSSFESTVSVAGQVQQTSASNLSGNNYVFFVQPQS
jgi:hypothetical protein